MSNNKTQARKDRELSKALLNVGIHRSYKKTRRRAVYDDVVGFGKHRIN